MTDYNAAPNRQNNFGKDWSYKETNYSDPYWAPGMTIEEFIDQVNTEIRVACSLPKRLPDLAIRNIIINHALPLFYREYKLAAQTGFIYTPRASYNKVQNVGNFFLRMPADIVNVTGIYEVNRQNMFQIGTTPIAMSVELGQNTAYMPSFIQSIADYGVYRVAIDMLSEMISYLSKKYHPYNYNSLTREMVIKTAINKDLMLEVKSKVPPEYLFQDQLFYQWVVGKSKTQLANILSAYDFPLPGNAKANYAPLVEQGKEEMSSVTETFKTFRTPRMYMVGR